MTADGHVCAVHSNNEYPLAEAVKDWRNIKTLYPMYNNIIGLRTDGTVVWAGFDPPFAELTGWKDIKALEKIGTDAVLVGETLMRAEDKSKALAILKGA